MVRKLRTTDSATARQRLSQRATQLKKSWILAALMAGHLPRGPEATIPDYSSWERRKLEGHVLDLEEDLCEAFKYTLASPKRELPPQALDWLVGAFDKWHHNGFVGLLRLSTALEFESNIGELRARHHLDIPPYAELLIQPGVDVAFRHPEYMLARDLEFLHDMYHDTERLLEKVDWSSPPEWARAGGENVQSLARSVVLTCFNLLESFVSGLARAHVMRNPNMDETEASKLLSTQDALRRRIVSVPRQILGREPSLDLNKPPLSNMFGDLKRYRDSFVHCEPGDQASARGYVKEALFHDVSPRLVEDAVSTTQAVIRLVWERSMGKRAHGGSAIGVVIDVGGISPSRHPVQARRTLLFCDNLARAELVTFRAAGRTEDGVGGREVIFDLDGGAAGLESC